MRTTRTPSLGPARWSARHPWTAVAAWVVFVIACVALASAVGTQQLGNTDRGTGAGAAPEHALAVAGFPSTVVENVLIQPRTDATPARLREAAGAATESLRSLAAVATVGEPVPSADRRSLLLPVTLAVDGRTGDAASSYAQERVVDVQTATRSIAARYPDLVVEQVGSASLAAALQTQVGADFSRAETLSLPVTLLILLVAFGALLAAAVPVGLALTSVAAAIGLSSLVSHIFPTTDVLNSVILLIGMAVGVDYSLFYIRRAREERAKGATTLESVDLAAATSGRAVLVSGVAVMIAMAGLFIAGSPVFSSMAIGTIIVVAVAVSGSLTVLPALLALLKDHIDRPRVPLVWRLRRRDGEGRFWPAVLRVVLARPVVSLVVALVALLGLAAPAISLSLKQTGAADLPRSIPELRTYDRLLAAYPNEGASHEVVVWSGTPLSRGGVDAAARRLAATTTAAPFAPSDTPVEFSPDGRTARFAVPISVDPGDPAARRSLDLLRGSLVPTAFAPLTATGVQVGVTGVVADDADFTTELNHRLPWVMAFVLGLTFVILVLAFRSVVIAATAVVLNLLSVGAAYGVLTLVFQHTWAESLLGFRSNGGIVPWLPLFLFVVLFGLSMDYHVFVVSRIREGWLRGLPVRDAVVDGVSRSAGVVTSAAVIMVGVFAIFGTLSMLDFKQLGVGLAVAVLLDATVVRGVLLPAAMAVLGERNWYLPSWLHRLPHLEAELPQQREVDLVGGATDLDDELDSLTEAPAGSSR
jgi:putative drug exporter of the RND superfamily